MRILSGGGESSELNREGVCVLCSKVGTRARKSINRQKQDDESLPLVLFVEVQCCNFEVPSLLLHAESRILLRIGYVVAEVDK